MIGALCTATDPQHPETTELFIPKLKLLEVLWKNARQKLNTYPLCSEDVHC